MNVNNTTLPYLLRELQTKYLPGEQRDSWTELSYSLQHHDLIRISQKPQVKTRKGGAFFPYLNKTPIDLTRYQIYSSVRSANYDLSCLEFALRESGIFTKVELESISSLVRNSEIPICKLPELCSRLDARIRVYHPDQNRTRLYGKGSREVCLALMSGHYFLDEMTKYTSYAVKNWEQLRHKPNWNLLVSDSKHDRSKVISSRNLVALMMSLGYFEEMSLSTEAILTCQYRDRVKEITTLEYSESDCQIEKFEEPKLNYSSIYYADFESFTEGETHQAYMCCAVSDTLEKTFTGSDCAEKFLAWVPNSSLVYFHNFGYDASFLIRHLQVEQIIKTGTSIKSITGKYLNKKIYFKDSAAMIAGPLRGFTKMFALDVKKELMPYSLYSAERAELETVPIQTALEYIREEDRDEFLELARDYLEGSDFYLYRYAEFYCLQDCRVLRDGFKKFSEWNQQITSFKPADFISLPQLANAHMARRGVFDGVYKLAGIPREFIQRCVKGGRCMTADNRPASFKSSEVCKNGKKFRRVMSDFDAVSLYPSAMSRLSYPKGKPKILGPSELNLEFLRGEGITAYYIEIRNVRVKTRRAFPLQSEKQDTVRNYTNDFTKSMYIDNIALEDFIRFQGAEFEIVRGYYFNEGTNDRVQECIKELFETRLRNKHNPIEKVYKLLMNAAYGRLIMKPVDEELVFRNSEEEHRRFISLNHNYISRYERIAEGKYVYHRICSVQSHFNYVQCGALVLSMSKRLMNEVMCLAEDIGIRIYYQDTDSMHLYEDEIPRLSEAYRAEYGRELIGKQLGQFHSDFEFEQDGKSYSSGVAAVESIFLGKKSYLDVLETPDGKHRGYHVRMKGVPSSAILAHNPDPLVTYKRWLAGEAIECDIAANKVIFKRNADFSMSTASDFKRNIRFTI